MRKGVKNHPVLWAEERKREHEAELKMYPVVGWRSGALD